MTNYRFTMLRTHGWMRLGGVGALASPPLAAALWALGAFGAPEQALRNAMTFGVAVFWLWLVVGFGCAWIVRGFMVRLKEPDDENADHAAGPARRPGPAPTGAAVPPHRPPAPHPTHP